MRTRHHLLLCVLVVVVAACCTCAEPAGDNWTRVPDDEAVFGGAGDQQIRSLTVGGPGLVAGGYDTSGGRMRGAVWVSPDGYHWTRIDDPAVFGGPASDVIYSVTAGGPGLVAVGWHSVGGDRDAAVWVSADGYRWTRIDDPAVFGGPGSQEMLSAATGGVGLVAAGYRSSAGHLDAAVWVSPDGYRWTRIDSQEAFGGPGSSVIYSVTAGGPGLVAVGHTYSPTASDGAAWVSADGYRWTRVDSPEAFGGPDPDEIRTVTLGGPGLVAGGSALWVSADGYDWSRLGEEATFAAGSRYVYSVTAGGPGLVAVGDGVWVSADGHRWTRVDDRRTLHEPDEFMCSVVPWRSGLVAAGLDKAAGDSDGAVWVSPPPG